MFVNPCWSVAVHIREVYMRTLLMSLSVLHQQCPKCLVHHIWMVYEMGSKWPHRCCFAWCCFLDLFRKAHHILVLLFSSSFFPMLFISVQVVHPYSSTDTATAWKKCVSAYVCMCMCISYICVPVYSCIYIYINIFHLVSFFNVISTFVGYLMQKPFLKKDNSGTINLYLGG